MNTRSYDCCLKLNSFQAWGVSLVIVLAEIK
jgi:hypothetical protein